MISFFFNVRGYVDLNESENLRLAKMLRHIIVPSVPNNFLLTKFRHISKIKRDIQVLIELHIEIYNIHALLRKIARERRRIRREIK